MNEGLVMGVRLLHDFVNNNRSALHEAKKWSKSKYTPKTLKKSLFFKFFVKHKKVFFYLIAQLLNKMFFSDLQNEIVPKCQKVQLDNSQS